VAAWKNELQMIFAKICKDDPYSLEQLKAPRMNITVVRPFVNSLYERKDLSVGKYCQSRSNHGR